MEYAECLTKSLGSMTRQAGAPSSPQCVEMTFSHLCDFQKSDFKTQSTRDTGLSPAMAGGTPQQGPGGPGQKASGTSEA